METIFEKLKQRVDNLTIEAINDTTLAFFSYNEKNYVLSMSDSKTTLVQDGILTTSVIWSDEGCYLGSKTNSLLSDEIDLNNLETEIMKVIC